MSFITRSIFSTVIVLVSKALANTELSTLSQQEIKNTVLRNLPDADNQLSTVTEASSDSSSSDEKTETYSAFMSSDVEPEYYAQTIVPQYEHLSDLAAEPTMIPTFAGHNNRVKRYTVTYSDNETPKFVTDYIKANTTRASKNTSSTRSASPNSGVYWNTYNYSYSYPTGYPYYRTTAYNTYYPRRRVYYYRY